MVLALNPANALPLFAVAEVNAYRISLKPCEPGVSGPDLPPGTSTETAAQPRIDAGRVRIANDANLISRPSIFLPRYSGVRPTISPAMKTARMANTRIP